MAISTKFVLEQGDALKGMGGAALGVLKQRFGGASGATPTLPGPEITEILPPRSAALVRTYARHVGGDPSAYKRRLPPHLFPQWGFGLAGKTLTGLPYPLAAAMNGGCKIINHAPLPTNEPLEVSVRLQSIDDDGRRAILEQRVITGTRSAPGALECSMYVFVPLKRRGGDKKKQPKGPPKDKARVPSGAKEIAFYRLRPDAGLDFAKLTGDFNPVHWVPAYARAFGFRNTILHGFGTLARACEGLTRGLFAGDVDALRDIHVRFTRPLVLPARVGLYVDGQDVFVGDAPGGPAYLTGTFNQTPQETPS